MNGGKGPVPAVLAVLAAVTLAAVAGCDGGSGEGAPTLSGRPSVTGSPTRSLPTVTRTRSDRPSSEAPTVAEPTADEPTAAEPTEAQDTGADEGATTYWPLVVALAALAAALGIWFVLHGRRSARRSWTASFEQARADAEELARDRAPSLLTGTRESRRGGWQMVGPGVLALENRLNELAASARDPEDAAVATGLGAAIGDLRRSLDQEVQTPDEPSAAAVLDLARAAALRLEACLSDLAAKRRL